MLQCPTVCIYVCVCVFLHNAAMKFRQNYVSIYLRIDVKVDCHPCVSARCASDQEGEQTLSDDMIRCWTNLPTHLTGHDA